MSLIAYIVFFIFALQSVRGSKVVTCQGICEKFCPSTELECAQLCRSACLETNKHANSEFELQYRFSLPAGENITGSDGLRKYSHSTFFFTTLEGSVYRYNTSSTSLVKIHHMPVQQLLRGEGKGLYDIALGRDFRTTRFVYLYYAAPCFNSTAAHCNVLSQYRYESESLVYVQDAAVFPQTSSRRSGGWAKMDARSYNYATMKVSIGGNENTDANVLQTRPELSSIFSFIPAKQDSDRESSSYEYLWHNEPWATGVGNPISCTRSLLSQRRMYCISARADGTHDVLKISGNRHYSNMSDCEEQTCSDSYKAGHAPMLSYQGNCAPSSITLYTGNTLRKKNRLLVSLPACYDGTSLRRASVAEVSFNHKADAWQLSPLRVNAPNLMFSEFVLFGADLHDKLYAGAFSLIDNEYQVFEFTKRN